jgi:glycolate oxidase
VLNAKKQKEKISLNSQALDEIKAIVGEDYFSDAYEDRLCYCYDAAIEEAMPDCIAKPGSVEEISAIMKLASGKKFPVYPRGAGTGLSGGSVPLRGGVALVLTRLNKLLEINQDDLYAVAETGLITVALHTAVEKLGLMYPPDPSSMKVTTMGGNVAENAGGLRGLKYGVTRDYVLELEIVTPGGDVFRVGSRCVKSVSGYDLARLYVGSEGTLGIITKITVKLLPSPEHKESMLVSFDDMGLAAKTVADIIKGGVIPATLEFMDNTSINAVEDFKKIGLPRTAAAILLIETDGVASAATYEAEKIIAICKTNGARDVTLAKNEAEKTSIWEGRRSCLSALARIRPTTILEDATVPRSKIPDMVRGVSEIANKYRLKIGNFGHAGDGNLHPTILTDLRDKEEMQRVENAIDEIFSLALKLGGTLTGEHGIGSAKAKYLVDEFGPRAVAAMRAIKNALDPNGILNPGKMFLAEG